MAIESIMARMFFRAMTTTMFPPRFLVLCVLCALLWCPCVVTALNLTVPTQSGAVKGVVMPSGAQAWLGIPFAAPPVDTLRWKPPQSVAPWSGVLDASASGSECPQLSRGVVQGSEDCLYLNVFRNPSVSPSSARPVMVFIHGGAFTGGGPIYAGNMAHLGDVVVVTIAYRLGPLGYLVTPEMLGDNVFNFGLLDQQKALQWVRLNIAAFGGDPNRVTIFGQSAGGASVLFHLLMKSSYSLYDQAIVESPEFIVYPTVDLALKVGALLTNATGCGTTSPLNCMRQVAVDNLFKFPFPDAIIPCVQTPQVTNQMLPLFESGQYNTDVPLILGTNADEGTFFSYTMLGSTWPNATIPEAQYDSTVTTMFHSMPDIAPLMLKTYAPVAQTQGYWKAFAQLSGNYFIICGTSLAVNNGIAAHHKAPFYRYQFNHGSTLWYYAALEATHGSELPYVFNDPSQDLLNGFTTREVSLALSVSSAWASFAASGSPVNTPVQWNTYDSSSSDVMMIDTVWSAAPSPHDAFCAQFEQLYHSNGTLV